jgi:prophage antirepressor-like protein
MNELTIYTNPAFGNIRGTMKDGEPWFVGKDVATALGYSNSRKAIADHVDEEDKTDGVTIRDAIGRDQNPVLINESGLYSLILSSKLPSARRFKHWVTSEVLPSIRRHGLYAIDEIIANPNLDIAALQALKEERDKSRALTAQVAMQSQQIAEMQPKVSYYDLVLSCPDALPITILAKDYGWTAQQMNKFLHKQGVQYKLQKTWLLYAKYQDKGYTESETIKFSSKDGKVITKMGFRWTEKGRKFIHETLKK